MLLRRLGLIDEDTPIRDALLAEYMHLFERPLAEDVLEAFANFFGWQLPRSSESPLCASQARLAPAQA